jgi:uncharacterized membrane protein
MPAYGLAFLIGVVAGLRAMTPLAAVSWAAHLRWLNLENTPLALLGSVAAPYITTLLAIAELINDKLPKTPSRKAPPAFIVRILVGAICGVAIAWSGSGAGAGAVAGAVGAVLGTLGGYEFRKRLVQATGGKNLPIALLEDAIAVAGAFAIVSRAS